jgi:membrane-bound serine protease (ClpP class)
MLRVLIALLLAGAPLASLAQGGGTQFPTAASGPPPESGYVAIVKIEGEIDDGVAVVVERTVKEAANADGIIFVIDTPGGRVDSAITITRHIMSAKCPTIAYVEGMGAISAGAIISYACDHIVMAPASNIGASTPITMGAQDEASQVTEKSMSFIRAKYRALGEENGHNPLLGEAMVDNEIELWGHLGADGVYTVYKMRGGDVVETHSTEVRGESTASETPPAALVSLRMQAPGGLPEVFRELIGEPAPEPETEEAPEAQPLVDEQGRPATVPEGADLISEAGKLLTLTSQEAVKYQLSPLQADTIDEAIGLLGKAELKRHFVVPTFAEELFAWLTSPMISGLLLMLGMGGLYMEVRTPGFGLPGIIGVSCLALFFGSYLVLGVADWADLIFVVAGLALLAAEIFVLPGFGVAGVAGIACLLTGFYLALVTNPIPQYDWDFARLNDAGQTLTTALLLFAGLVAMTWNLFPRTPLARWLVLADTQDNAAGYIVQSDEEERLSTGLRGEALSFLRPAGRARFAGKNYDVVTRGEFIEAGIPIRIIQVYGNRYVVARDEGDIEA